MSNAPRRPSAWSIGPFDRGTVLSFAVGVLLITIIIWGALQSHDPLKAFIKVDKFRHIAGFGTLGLCAAFAPGLRTRIGFVTTAIVFAMLLEIMQGVLTTDRTMSLGDFLASSIGVFAGFGLGSAGLGALEIARQFRDDWFDRQAIK